MKKIAGVIAGLALLLLQVGGAGAQTSDYEIIETYKSRHRSLMESVKAARDPAQCAALEGEIARLEADHERHRKLLGEGLHPESLEASIAALREQLRKSAERIAQAEEIRQDKARIAEDGKRLEEIGRQNVEYRASVEKLTLDVKDLSAQVERLSAENTGLLEQIRVLQAESRKDKAAIARLTELNAKLTANIQARDELILKMMDSLFAEYAKAGLTDVQKKNLFVDARDNDYVSKIITTIDGNVNYAETALLSPQDVKFIRDEQRKLAAKWDEIKPFVGRLYPDEQLRTRDIATVDGRVSDWKRSVDDTTWKSIRQVFAGQNVDIGPFRNAGEFHERLLAYLDGQLKDPSRDKHRAFMDTIWNSPLQDQWLPIISTDELTQKQRSEIEERIALWDKAIVALFWRRVLIGVLGAAAAAVLAFLAWRRKKPSPLTPA